MNSTRPNDQASGDPIAAVLDIGSNSVKMLVAEISGGAWRTLADEMAVTRLAAGLRPGGRLDPPAAERTLAGIAGLVGRARALGADRFAAAGTMALRQAADAAEFIRRAAAAIGVEPEILTGESEARLVARAVLADRPAGGDFCICDIGGGSTELALVSGGRIGRRISLPVGVRSRTERFGLDGPIPATVLAALADELAADLEPAAAFAGAEVMGTGGTAITLAAMERPTEPFDPKAVEGLILTVGALRDRASMLATLDVPGRRRIPGLMPERADVILAGAAISLAVLRLLGRDLLTVSRRGLRHGLLLERFGGGAAPD